MNINDILKDQAGVIAVFILIYIGIAFLLLFLVWVGRKVFKPMFEKTAGDDLKDYLKEIASVGKAIKPKDALWSKADISKENAILTFGKEGSPHIGGDSSGSKTARISHSALPDGSKTTGS